MCKYDGKTQKNANDVAAILQTGQKREPKTLFFQSPALPLTQARLQVKIAVVAIVKNA